MNSEKARDLMLAIVLKAGDFRFAECDEMQMAYDGPGAGPELEELNRLLAEFWTDAFPGEEPPRLDSNAENEHEHEGEHEDECEEEGEEDSEME